MPTAATAHFVGGASSGLARSRMLATAAAAAVCCCTRGGSYWTVLRAADREAFTPASLPASQTRRLRAYELVARLPSDERERGLTAAAYSSSSVYTLLLLPSSCGDGWMLARCGPQPGCFASTGSSGSEIHLLDVFARARRHAYAETKCINNHITVCIPSELPFAGGEDGCMELGLCGEGYGKHIHLV